MEIGVCSGARHIVEHGHLFAALQQTSSNIAADETAAARDKIIHEDRFAFAFNRRRCQRVPTYPKMNVTSCLFVLPALRFSKVKGISLIRKSERSAASLTRISSTISK